MFKNKRFRVICILCCMAFALVIYNKSNIVKWKLQRQINKYLSSYEKLASVKAKTFCPQLPIHLTSIPLADHEGIITDVKRISIRNVIDPYNACIMKKDENNYTLFFRLDTQDKKNIAYVELDKDFNQTSAEYIIVNTHSTTSEDARAIHKDDEMLLVYNEYDEEAKLRLMRLAALNRGNNQPNYIIPLDLNKNRCEKNWMPFVHENNLHFEYYINPHVILTLPEIKNKNSLMTIHSTEITKLPWQNFWGELRGGTPAQKIGDQYLGFFHSYFKSRKRQAWYVMGAYTFEAEPPFRITGISPYPILFEGMYDSPRRTRTYCIYPCGFVSREENGRKFLHVSCGENDTSIKIITMDQEALLKSLIPVI